MIHDDQRYYERRALQEDVAARSAVSPVARERHRQLAAAYRLRRSVGDAPGAIGTKPHVHECPARAQ